MRRIYRYTPQAKKYLSAIIKQRMPESQPWLHVGVKTWSNRNPFAAICIWVWDTRQVIWEHRFSNANLITNEKMKVANSGMQLANDNRQPLVGGRKDVNEWMELGSEFDASKGTAFDGKDRVKFTKLYKRRVAKQEPKPGNEGLVEDAWNGDKNVRLSDIKYTMYKDAKDQDCAVTSDNGKVYLLCFDHNMGRLTAVADNMQALIEDNHLQF